MRCEMCGKESPTLTAVRVEGSVLQLCASCSRFGAAVNPPAPAFGGDGANGGAAPPPAIQERLGQRARRMEERDLFRELPEMELAPDWPKKIRVAREKLLWTPEELAKRLNEKKSVVLKMEAGNFRPPDGTIRKIEHLLKIRLRADAAVEGA